MSREWTLSECFAHFGATGANPRWSWSARSSDDKTVVLTLWQDQFKRGPGNTTIYEAIEKKGGNWLKRPGNRERLNNLIHAHDYCDGQFHVVVTIARDINANPRSIAECFPHDRLIMRITELDRQTGEFRAVSIDG